MLRTPLSNDESEQEGWVMPLLPFPSSTERIVDSVIDTLGTRQQQAQAQIPVSTLSL